MRAPRSFGRGALGTAFGCALAWCALAGFGGALQAQPQEPSAPAEPAPQGAQQPDSPAEPQPAPSPQPAAAALPLLLPEGTFVPARSAALVMAGTGERVVVLAATPRDAVRAMILLPSPGLQEADRLLLGSVPTEGRGRGGATGSSAGTGEAVPVVVSGRVYVYQRRNYLLPLTVRLGEGAGVGGAARGEKPQTGGEMSGNGGLGAGDLDPQVRGFLDELERLRDEPRALAAAAPDPIVPEGPSTTTNDPSEAEGLARPMDQRIVRRTGRVLRVGGAWTFVLDTGAGSPGTPDQYESDRPMPILPCRMLEGIEAVANRRGPGVRIELTGLVTHFRERPMVLPTYFQTIEASELRPLPR